MKKNGEKVQELELKPSCFKGSGVKRGKSYLGYGT